MKNKYSIFNFLPNGRLFKLFFLIVENETEWLSFC